MPPKNLFFWHSLSSPGSWQRNANCQLSSGTLYLTVTWPPYNNKIFHNNFFLIKPVLFLDYKKRDFSSYSCQPGQLGSSTRAKPRLPWSIYGPAPIYFDVIFIVGFDQYRCNKSIELESNFYFWMNLWEQDFISMSYPYDYDYVDSHSSSGGLV